MADDIRLVIGVEQSGLLKAITNTESLERKVKKLSDAYNRGDATVGRYNRAIAKLAKSSKQSVDELDRYGKKLRDNEKATKQATAETKAFTLARKQAAEEDRRRTAVIKSNVTALNEQRVANQSNTAELKKLRMATDSVYAAEQKMLRMKKLLRTEVANGNMTLKQAAAAQLLYRKSVQQTNSTMNMAKNRMNGNNMAIQQLGYQFGDFAVQVQGGTSAFVAFSQQGAQLAGILPMIAGPLGLSMGAAVGLSAALGILIPIGSAIGRMFFEMKDAAKEAVGEFSDLKDTLDQINAIDMAQGFTDDMLSGATAVKTEFSTILAIMKEIQATKLQEQLVKGLDPLRDAYGSYKKETVAAAVSRTKAPEFDVMGFKDESRFLQAYELIANITGKTKEELQQSVAQQTLFLRGSGLLTKEVKAVLAEYGNVVGVIEAAKDAQDEITSPTVDLQKNLEVLRKRSNEWTRSASAGYKVFQKTAAEQRKADEAVEKAILKANQAVEEKIRLQDQARELQAIELSAGKESAKYTQQAAKFERENLALKMRQAGVDEDLITSMLAGNIHLEVGLELLKKQTAELALQAKYTSRIFEGSAAGIALSKYGSRGTNLPPPKDPTETTTPTGPKVVDPYANLQKQLELEEALIGKTEARKRVINALGVDQSKWGPEAVTKLENEVIAVQKLQAAEEERIRVIEEAKKQQEDLANTIASSMETAMMSMVDGTKTVKDAFRDMARDIIKHLYKVLVVQQMINALGGFMSTSSNATISNIGGELSTMTLDGGGYTGDAPRSGGLDGKGGFMAMMHPRETVIDHTKANSGGTGQNVVINQSFNFAANGDDSVKRIIAQAAPQIAQMTKNSMLNDRRRGGTTKAVFG